MQRDVGIAGVDAGDHPPITPLKAATEREVGGGDAWRLYEMVSRNFIGSLSPDCLFEKVAATFQALPPADWAWDARPGSGGAPCVYPWPLSLFRDGVYRWKGLFIIGLCSPHS